MSGIDADIRDTLEGLERLVRGAGEDVIADHIQRIIQASDQVTALHEVFSKFFQRVKKPNESQTERHNFFTNFSSTEGTLSSKQITDLVSITKDWKIDNKQVCFLRSFAQLWERHPALFWHGPPDNDATRRCIEDLEHIRQIDPSKRKVLLVMLSDDVSLEQKRNCTCPNGKHEQRGDDLQSIRAPHLRISIKKLHQKLYPGISEQQKRIKKARISQDSLSGWKWKLLKNFALILSLVNANVKRYEVKRWKNLEVDAINAYMQTLPQFGILDDLEKAWDSVVAFYRGSHQQRVQASDRLLIPTNAQDLQPMATQLNDQSSLPTGVNQILEIPLIDSPKDRKKKRQEYRQRPSRKRQCMQKTPACDIGPQSDVQDKLEGVSLPNEQFLPMLSQPNNGVSQTTILDSSACENVGNDVHQNEGHVESLVPTLASLHKISELWSNHPQDALSNMEDMNLSTEQEGLTLENLGYPESLVTALDCLHSTPLSPNALIEASRTFFNPEA